MKKILKIAGVTVGVIAALSGIAFVAGAIRAHKEQQVKDFLEENDFLYGCPCDH